MDDLSRDDLFTSSNDVGVGSSISRDTGSSGADVDVVSALVEAIFVALGLPVGGASLVCVPSSVGSVADVTDLGGGLSCSKDGGLDLTELVVVDGSGGLGVGDDLSSIGNTND